MPMSNALSLANFKAPLKGILKPWDFDLDEITFTASMAKRATGVFATAPIVQGNWAGGPTPDAMTFPRGALLGNLAQEWYANLDPYQGSIVLWITPEWDGDDGKSHYFIAGGSGMLFGLSLYKNSSDELVLQSDMTELETVDISAWAAGTTYCVIASWDTKNTIDGTNYARMSVNNVHSYDQASTFTPTTNTTIRIGSAFTAGIQTSPANAILEGLTIYRRVLWDGTYGKDVGNGIETTLIYAAGVGADPCLITGSWDVVFCVPTDSAAGALVTGPGEAWSHPHGSAELDHGFVDDGFGPHQESAILFNGNNTNVNLTSNVVFDDMPDGANGFQVGCWVRFDASAGDNYIVLKTQLGVAGWWLRLTNDGTTLQSYIYCGGGNHAGSSAIIANNPQWEDVIDGKWHWILLSFHHSDNGGDGKIYFQVGGKWATVYGLQIAEGAAYISDAALTMYYGRSTSCFDGAGGWLALWNDVTTYPVGTDNIAPRTKPGAGGNLIEAWQCDDRVNAITATVTTPGNDGLLANGLWERKFNVEATPVMPQSVELDTPLNGTGTVGFGSGALIDNLPAGANGCTLECWVRVPPVRNPTVNDYMYILRKGTNIILGMYNYGRPYLQIITAGGTSIAVSGASYRIDDGVWHHIRGAFESTVTGGDGASRIWIDGILRGTGTAYAGAYVGDAADDLVIVRLHGLIGPIRYSDTIRNTIDFTPASRTDWYANDANAQLICPMTDGAGVTVTDNSGNGYNGTIAGTYRWLNTYDMELDSPGARVFQNGYVFGANGVGDGIGHQFVVTAETDYVVRFIGSPGQDSRGLNNLYIYDVTNAAQIGANYQMPSYHGIHTAGNNLATLTDNTARWPQSLVGATVYNITDGSLATITAISGDMQTITGGLAGGTDNDWDTNDVYRIFWADGYHKHPWTESFVFRTPAACVLVDIRLLSLDGEGTLYAHQVEVQESLIDNGDIEAALVGVPPLPAGWNNSGLDAGDTQAEAVTVHAGAQSLEWNPGAVPVEGTFANINVVTGSFLSSGVWTYGDGAVGLQFSGGAARAVLQYVATIVQIETPVTAVWSHNAGVFRRESDFPRLPFMRANAGAGGDRFIDDAYTILLDDVTLTVTPASYANSLESGGLRIDGYDNAPQPIPAGAIRANRGSIRWPERFRHTAALLADFGNTGATLLHTWGNATNYIRVYATAANNIRLEFNDGGGVHQANWNCTGLVAVDTAYVIEVRWNPGRMQLYQDGTMRTEIVQPVSFATIPTIAYWGSQQAGDEQIDAVFGAP